MGTLQRLSLVCYFVIRYALRKKKERPGRKTAENCACTNALTKHLPKYGMPTKPTNRPLTIDPRFRGCLCYYSISIAAAWSLNAFKVAISEATSAGFPTPWLSPSRCWPLAAEVTAPFPILVNSGLALRSGTMMYLDTIIKCASLKRFIAAAAALYADTTNGSPLESIVDGSTKVRIGRPPDRISCRYV